MLTSAAGLVPTAASTQARRAGICLHVDLEGSFAYPQPCIKPKMVAFTKIQCSTSDLQSTTLPTPTVKIIGAGVYALFVKESLDPLPAHWTVTVGYVFQDPKNKQFMLCDEQMQGLFGKIFSSPFT